MTHRNKSRSIGLLMIVVFSAVFLWALTAVVWPVPVVYADGPEIITITVSSSLEAYFHDPGLDPTGGTVYFNSLSGEGGGQVITVTTTVSGSMPITLTGATAFGMTPISDTNSTGELGITYTIGTSAGTENGVLFTVTDSDGFTDTALITFTQDITDPTIVSPTITETSPYLYADDLTLYYSDLMSGTPQSFTVQGNATDNDGAGLDQATFSSAFGVAPPADDDPASWSGTYDDVESGDNGDGTITVTVTDNVGNWSEQTFDYTEDTTDPTVSLTSVTSPGYDENTDPLDDDGSNWYDPDNLSGGWYFTSTVTDTLSGLALANASWDHSNDAYDQLTYDPGLDGDGVFNGVSDDGDGVVTVTLTITDNVGNSDGDTVVLNLDNTEPTIYPGSPPIVEGSPYLYASDLTVYYGDEMGTASQAFTVQGNAQDSGVGLHYVSYSAALNQGYFEDFTHLEAWYRDYTANQSHTTSGVITATVYDRLGHFATQTFTYTRDITSPDISYGSPPIVENSPHDALYADGTTVYYSDQMGGTAQSFTVQGDATDNSGGAGLWRATFYSPHLNDPGDDLTFPDWSGTYYVDSSESGSGTITVTVYDNVSNWSQRTFDYFEDTAAPTVVLTDVTDPGYDENTNELDTDGSNWYDPDNLNGGWYFTSTVTDTLSGLALANASWDHSNDAHDQLTYDPGLDGDGVFNGVDDDGDGVVTVTLTITDNVGNSDSDTVVLNLDNTKPVITSPSIDNYYNSPWLHVDGLTIYYGDDMPSPQRFYVEGDSTDGAGVGLDRADFSDAFGAAPSDDTTPSSWSGGYDPDDQDWGSGTITVTVRDRLYNYDYENFYYIRDTLSPTVDVTCPAVTSVPSWTVSWSGSDSPPASGLKHFDVQYKVESGAWQNWHTDTSLTEDTFGPTSPVIVEDDHTYYFRVRAEDNVSNESSYTSGQDATLYHSGIKKVFLPLLWAPNPNWGFETGDFTNWQHGGQLRQSVVRAEPHSGNYSARLGWPGYDCEGGVPVGSAWLRRNVKVPSSGSPTLSFWYRIYSHDKNTALSDDYDLFVVDINGSVEVVRDANTSDPYGCSSLRDLGWKQVVFPLSAPNDYRGQTIQIAFYVYNRPDGWYNTYVYVDDVSVQ